LPLSEAKGRGFKPIFFGKTYYSSTNNNLCSLILKTSLNN
jgi:hypothetical protein